MRERLRNFLCFRYSVLFFQPLIFCRCVFRTALEVCGLPSSKLVPPAATQADNVGNPDVTSYREEILRKYREKWSKYSENDNLEAGLRKYKKFATEAIKRDRFFFVCFILLLKS